MSGHVEKDEVGRKSPFCSSQRLVPVNESQIYLGYWGTLGRKGLVCDRKGSSTSIRLCWRCIVEMDKEESQWVQRLDIRIVGETL